MWNLQPRGAGSTVYRPTTSSGTATNPGYAYDVDAYPWATKAVKAQSGSAVAGTPDNISIIYSGFATLAKSAFSSINLSIVARPQGVADSEFAYIITCALAISYSTDGGSTWTDISTIGTSYLPEGSANYITVFMPAQDISGPIASGGFNSFNEVAVFRKVIPSGAMSVGLQSLQVKITLSTLTSTRAGNPASYVTVDIWDIAAEVS